MKYIEMLEEFLGQKKALPVKGSLQKKNSGYNEFGTISLYALHPPSPHK